VVISFSCLTILLNADETEYLLTQRLIAWCNSKIDHIAKETKILNFINMKNTLAIICLFSISNVVMGQQQPILVTAQWLKEHQNDPKLVLVQVNYLQFDYDNEHIAGAHYLWPEWLAPNSPEGSFNAPDPVKASALLQSMGVSNDSHIVLCHIRNEVSVTARMFLTLEHLGLRDHVSFLNGGLDAWKKEGYSVTREVPSVKKGNFKAKPQGLLVDKEYVLKTLKSNDGLVVDARMQRFYDGEPTGNPRDGHITGAKNIPYTELVDEANFFKPLDKLESYFVPIAGKDKELVVYCFIGQTASVVYMAGRMLDYNVKLYDGSLQEWSRKDELPMEKTEPK
jgi:thiosulfate/3-mercaptopyruvate sulfurtransferase